MVAHHRPRPRFFLEILLSFLSSGALLLSMVQSKWIEAVFHADPDGGSGSFEALVTGGLIALSVCGWSLVFVHWRHYRTHSGETCG